MLKFTKKTPLNENKLYNIFFELSLKVINETTTVQELADKFHENGIAINLLIFALPLALPIPYPPGLAILISIVLMILSLQMLLGYRKIWLPNKLKGYELKNKYLVLVSKKALKIIILARKVSKPKYAFASSIYCEQLIGFLSLIGAMIIIAPIPFANLLPACSIVVMSIGLLNRNGIIIIFGIFLSLLGLAVAVGLLTASWMMLKSIIIKVVRTYEKVIQIFYK